MYRYHVNYFFFMTMSVYTCMASYVCTLILDIHRGGGRRPDAAGEVGQLPGEGEVRPQEDVPGGPPRPTHRRCAKWSCLQSRPRLINSSLTRAPNSIGFGHLDRKLWTPIVSLYYGPFLMPRSGGWLALTQGRILSARGKPPSDKRDPSEMPQRISGHDRSKLRRPVRARQDAVRDVRADADQPEVPPAAIRKRVSTASFQYSNNLEQWAQPLGDLNFRRAFRSKHKQWLWDLRPSI